MKKEAADEDVLRGWRDALDRLAMEELIALQRSVRDVIDAKRKLAGTLRKLDSGAPQQRRLPEPLHVGKAGYRVLVSRVAPAHSRASLDKLDRCVLGVSLGGSNALAFHGAKLEAIVRWIAARVSHCCVLVGDNLGRISLEVRQGLDPEVAEREALALGRRYAAETESLFRRYTTGEVRFEIRYGTEYAAHRNFRPYHDDVRALYNANTPFRELVHTFGDEYLARTAQSLGRGEADSSERWRWLAREYLLEEIAMLACLAEDGWPVLVYPGSIDSVIEIAEGRHPSLPAPLRDLRFIALWLDAKRGLQ